MGRRGPVPRPIEQRKEEGTLRAGRHPSVPLVVGGREAPKPAAYLTPAQRREFRRIVAELKDSRLLDSADRGMIELTAIEVDVVAQCNKALAEALTVEVTRGGYGGKEEYTVCEASPYLRMREEAVNKLRYLYRELGIGPASRAALAINGATGKTPLQALPGVGCKPTPIALLHRERVEPGDDLPGKGPESL